MPVGARPMWLTTAKCVGRCCQVPQAQCNPGHLRGTQRSAELQLPCLKRSLEEGTCCSCPGDQPRKTPPHTLSSKTAKQLKSLLSQWREQRLVWRLQASPDGGVQWRNEQPARCDCWCHSKKSARRLAGCTLQGGSPGKGPGLVEQRAAEPHSAPHVPLAAEPSQHGGAPGSAVTVTVLQGGVLQVGAANSHDVQDAGRQVVAAHDPVGAQEETNRWELWRAQVCSQFELLRTKHPVWRQEYLSNFLESHQGLHAAARMHVISLEPYPGYCVLHGHKKVQACRTAHTGFALAQISRHLDLTEAKVIPSLACCMLVDPERLKSEKFLEQRAGLLAFAGYVEPWHHADACAEALPGQQVWMESGMPAGVSHRGLMSWAIMAPLSLPTARAMIIPPLVGDSEWDHHAASVLGPGGYCHLARILLHGEDDSQEGSQSLKDLISFHHAQECTGASPPASSARKPSGHTDTANLVYTAAQKRASQVSPPRIQEVPNQSHCNLSSLDVVVTALRSGVLHACVWVIGLQCHVCITWYSHASRSTLLHMRQSNLLVVSCSHTSCCQHGT